MFTALYYPYFHVGDQNLVKQSLLLWDRVETIDPDNIRGRPTDRLLARADEMIFTSYAPDWDEKKAAHDILVKLGDIELPPWFLFQANNLRDYIWPQKFLPETWDFLQQRRLVEQGGPKDWFWASPATSLLLMAVLADCCAGKTKRTCTDEVAAYQALSRYLTLQNHGSMKLPAPTDDVLSVVPLKTLDVSSVSLESLVRLREKEFGANGHTFTEARHKLLKRLDDHVKTITKPEHSKADRLELDRQFENEMNRDYADLKQELGWAGRDWILSKEMGVVVAAVSGAIAAPAAAPALVLGGAALGSITRKYHAARKQIIKGHVTSYVYLAKHQGFEWDLR